MTCVVAAAAAAVVLALTASSRPASPRVGTTAVTASAPNVQLSAQPAFAVDSSVSGDPDLITGINVGSAVLWELQFAETLGAHNVRMDIPLGTPIAQIDPIIGAYALAGIRPELLATFDGSIPTPAQDEELATWAARYGPGGSFWKTGLYAANLGVTRIEFGNESSSNYEYPQLATDSSWYSSPVYAQIAEEYGRSYVQAVRDVTAANPAVRVLAVADSPGQVPQWLQGMFRGAPDLASVVQGWVLHPYGNEWQHDLSATLDQTEALGASADVPVYITEVGVASADGRCLEDNYGWNPCETYSQAGDTLTTQVQGIEADLGARLAELDIYSARDLAPAGSSNDDLDFFGALQSSGAPKAGFTSAVENILASSAS